MHDLPAVHVVESLKNLFDYVNDLDFGEGALIFYLSMKVAIGDQLHHNIVVKRIFNQLDHLYNIDMVSLRNNGQLVLIQLLHVLVSRQTALLDNFDGTPLPRLPIFGLHNRPEISAADFGLNLVLVAPVPEPVHPLEDAFFRGCFCEHGPIRPRRTLLAFFEEKLAQIRPQVLTVLSLSSFRGPWLQWIKFRCATTAH